MRKAIGRTPKSLGYIRPVTANEYRVLNAAAIFSRHTCPQNLIDDFLTRVKRRTIEVMDLYRERQVDLRRMVERAVEEEIASALSEIEAGANRRFGDGESESEEIHTHAA